ncbi:MAG: mandelate racemase/muconate lactonizing enzyme family protein [Acidobacteria bacterium]|nr:mandelate racemase/muconate lactonizing enzyme family protein [Acidobacteriota bacterium]
MSSGWASGARAADRKGTRIRKVEVIPVGIEFRTAFNIGVGQVGGKGLPGKYVYVKATTDDGHVGWGATTTVPNWSYETVEAVVGTLEHHLAPIAIGRSPFEWNALKKEMDARIRPAVSNGAPFAKSAIEIAFLDLAGQISGQPVHALLGGKVHDTLDLCYAVSIDEPDAMAAEVARWPACWCFKVKVSGDTDKDVLRLRAISDARPDAVIWLDANQSYQSIALERFLHAIAQFDKIRCFEQPVRSEDWLGMRRAREKSPYPVAIDEGCFSSFDVARMSRLDAADLVVLKVPKSGGVTNCYKSAVVSEANGLGLLGSGLTDAGVSFMAAIHLYSTLDLLLPPELNGPQFLTSMMAEGIQQDGVTVTVPDTPGLGITVSEETLRAHQIKVG